MKFYVCNGKREGCGGSSVCRQPGGCFHTSDIFYALYDEHEDFEPLYHSKDDSDLWERIKQRNKKHGII